MNNEVIKQWRTERHAEGQPSGLRDFFIVNDVCPSCSLGLFPFFDANGIVIQPQSSPCARCKGTRKWNTTFADLVNLIKECEG